MVLNYLPISRNLFSFYRIESSPIMNRPNVCPYMFKNGQNESPYNRKQIRKYSDKQSHIAFSSFRLVSDCSRLQNFSIYRKQSENMVPFQKESYEKS